MAVLIAVAAAVLSFQRRNLRRRRQSEEEASAKQQPLEKSELDAKDSVLKQLPQPSSEAEGAELAGSTVYVRELSSDASVEASTDSRFPEEMAGSGVDVPELEGPGGRRPYHELPSRG